MDSTPGYYITIQIQIQLLYSWIGLFHRKSILFDITASHTKSYKGSLYKVSPNLPVRSFWGKEMIQMCHGNSLPSVWEVPTYPAQFRSVWEKGKEMTATHSQAGLRPESQTGVGERTDNWGTDLTPFLESGAKPSCTVVCARFFHCDFGCNFLLLWGCFSQMFKKQIS